MLDSQSGDSCLRDAAGAPPAACPLRPPARQDQAEKDTPAVAHPTLQRHLSIHHAQCPDSAVPAPQRQVAHQETSRRKKGSVEKPDDQRSLRMQRASVSREVRTEGPWLSPGPGAREPRAAAPGLMLEGGYPAKAGVSSRPADASHLGALDRHGRPLRSGEATQCICDRAGSRSAWSTTQEPRRLRAARPGATVCRELLVASSGGSAGGGCPSTPGGA